MGVPFAAERMEVDAGRESMSALEAGKTLTAAPVSTKKWVPLPGSVKINKLWAIWPGDVAVSIAWHVSFPVFHPQRQGNLATHNYPRSFWLRRPICCTSRAAYANQRIIERRVGSRNEIIDSLSFWNYSILVFCLNSKNRSSWGRASIVVTPTKNFRTRFDAVDARTPAATLGPLPVRPVRSFGPQYFGVHRRRIFRARIPTKIVYGSTGFDCFLLKNSFFAHCQADDSPVSIPFQTPPHLPVLVATQSSISCLSRRTSLPGEQSSPASTSHSTLHSPTMNGRTWNPNKGYARKKHGRQRIAPVLRLLPWDGAFPTSGRERTATTVDSALLPYSPSHCFGSLHYVIYTISASNLARLLGGGMLHLKSCIRESADHRAESRIKKRDH